MWLVSHRDIDADRCRQSSGPEVGVDALQGMSRIHRLHTVSSPAYRCCDCLLRTRPNRPPMITWTGIAVEFLAHRAMLGQSRHRELVSPADHRMESD
jgi:hypothetical protein